MSLAVGFVLVVLLIGWFCDPPRTPPGKHWRNP